MDTQIKYQSKESALKTFKILYKTIKFIPGFLFWYLKYTLIFALLSLGIKFFNEEYNFFGKSDITKSTDITSLIIGSFFLLTCIIFYFKLHRKTILNALNDRIIAIESIKKIRSISHIYDKTYSHFLASSQDFTELEKLRKKHFFKFIGVTALSCAILCAIFIYPLANVIIKDADIEGKTIIIALIGIYLCYCIVGKLYFQAKTKFRLELKDIAFKKIAEQFSLTYDKKGVLDLKILSQHKVFNNKPTYDIEDGFHGQYEGRDIGFQEILLNEKAKSNRNKTSGGCLSLIFAPFLLILGPIGLLILAFKARSKTLEHMPSNAIICRVSLNKTLDSQTIAEKKGIFSFFKTYDGLKPVKVTNSKLEKNLNIYSNDKMEAHLIFDPLFMEKFAGLTEHLSIRTRTDNVIASFLENELVIIALSQNDFFEMGSLIRTIRKQDFEPVIRHIAIYLIITDLLNHDSKRGL